MDKLLRIEEAAKLLGVSTSTLRRWERSGKLKANQRTEGNQRRYSLASIRPDLVGRNKNEERKTIIYARVSSVGQRADLERQVELLELFCAKNGWKYELLKDIGSGINYYKKGLKKLLDLVMAEKVRRLVITHKDRLLRFGAELIFTMCEAKGIEIVILNKGENCKFEEDLVKDVLEIITVFSARLYGSRSHKNKELIAGLKEACRPLTKLK
jgi:excisionase family DNA binding protein